MPDRPDLLCGEPCGRGQIYPLRQMLASPIFLWGISQQSNYLQGLNGVCMEFSLSVPLFCDLGSALAVPSPGFSPRPLLLGQLFIVLVQSSSFQVLTHIEEEA